MELHYEMRSPTLGTHPFFRCYADVNPAGVRKVCHEATQALMFSKGDEVFHYMHTPTQPRVYFVVKGDLLYFKDTADAEASQEVFNYHWLSEAVLWTHDWTHCGTLKARVDCQLLGLDAARFQEIVSSFGTWHARRYAEQFVIDLNETNKDFHTDIGEYSLELGDRIAALFEEQWAYVKSDFVNRRKDQQRPSYVQVLARISSRESHKGSLEKV